MSVQYGKLCSVILSQHFGEHVQKVGDCLFSAVQSRTLSMLIKSTGLSKSEVSHALCVLLKFRLAKFLPSKNEQYAEFSLIKEHVLLILRYPRYVHLVQTKMINGQVAASIVEELLRSGIQSATKLFVRCCDSKENYIVYENTFIDLCQSNYILRAPVIIEGNTSPDPFLIPQFRVDENNLYLPPKLSAIEWDKLRKDEKYETSDKDIFWIVNFDRFHQDFRDSLMISAMERKIDANAGECLKYILQQMYACTQPWLSSSNPISFADIRHLVQAKSLNLELIKYLDQYISIILDDQLRFLSKYGDMGGGQYLVETKNAIDQLTWVCIENVITEKFGTKAARIFRVINQKRYVEQEVIQREAMIPSKEAKLYTYKLLEEHFVQTKPIRKPGGGGTGMAKSFFLFHVNQQQIVSMLLETCYKALYNSMIRSAFNKSENKRLIDKSQRLESIVEAMKERGETEEYIAEIFETLTPPEREVLHKVKVRIKSLYSAEIGLDETIFLLQLFLKYRQLQ